MDRFFLQSQVNSSFSLWYYNQKWLGFAYPQNNGLGPKNVKNFNFVERMYYGAIDDQNNAIIPDEQYIVQTNDGRVFDFVADSLALMRLNYLSAIRGGMINPSKTFMSEFKLLNSYSNPKARYGEYLSSILQYYNETHIPNFIGNTIITSYDSYVKHFFNFFSNEGKNIPLTMSKWLLSKFSSPYETGLAFSYADISPDEDQRKINEIIDSDSFDYFKNLTLNMGFSISHHTPNMLMYDVASPAGASIRRNYGLNTLSDIFNSRYIKTYTLDMNIINKYINIYYNKYVSQNPLLRFSEIKCMRVVTEFKSLNSVNPTKRPFSDTKELIMYARIRNVEEGRCFNPVKMRQIERKIKKMLSTLDKPSALRYINNMFRDQLWNKDNGYHDGIMKLTGKTVVDSRRSEVGRRPSGRDSRSY